MRASKGIPVAVLVALLGSAARPAVALDLAFDGFRADGNVFGPSDGVPDLIDEFDDGVLGPTWNASFGPSFETGSLLHVTSPGSLTFVNDVPVELSNVYSTARLLAGRGSATVDVRLPAGLPAPGEILSLTLTDEIASEIFSASLVHYPGPALVQSVGAGGVGGFQMTDQRAPLNAGSLTGPVVLRIVWDDGRATLQAAFSLDGGATFTAPFPPEPVIAPLARRIFLNGLVVTGGTTTTSATSTSVTSTSSSSSTTVPFAASCPLNLCACLGEAARHALVAADRARILHAQSRNPDIAGDACATRVRVVAVPHIAPLLTRDLVALAPAPGRAVVLAGSVSVAGDVASGGGTVVVHDLASVAGAVDESGGHPGLATCQQALADAAGASQTLAALAPTRSLGVVRPDGFHNLAAGPGLNVWSASEIVLRKARIDVTLDPATDALVINTPRLVVRDGGIFVHAAGGAWFAGDPVRVIVNVPGAGPTVVAKGVDLAVHPPILAPGRHVKLAGDGRPLYGRHVTALRGRVEPLACPP